MRTGVPGHAHARSAIAALVSSFRSASRPRQAPLAPMQSVVIDDYPYYVVKDPDSDDGEVWFDALTGGMIAGPHESDGAPPDERENHDVPCCGG